MRSFPSTPLLPLLAAWLLCGSAGAQVDPGKPLRPVPPLERGLPSRSRTPSQETGAGPADRRLVPEPVRQAPLWRLWWHRNRWAYVGTNAGADAAAALAPGYLLDPEWGEEQRQLRREDVLKALREYLEHRDLRLRGAAHHALGIVGGSGIKTLQSALNSDTQHVGELALLGAAESPASTITYHLLRMAAGDGESKGSRADQEDHQDLAALFLSLGNRQMLGPILRDFALDHTLHDNRRSLFVAAMGLDGSKDLVAPLLAILGDSRESITIRCTAIHSLARIHDAAAAEEVMKLLWSLDAQSDLRVSAALAVGSLVDSNDRVHLRQLHRLANGENNLTVRSLLLLSIGRIAGPDAELILARALEHGSSQEQIFAGLGLGLLVRETGSHSAFELLRSDYHRQRSLDQKLALAAALGLSQHKEALPILTAEVDSGESPALRSVAAEGLAVLGFAQAGAPLKSCLEHETDPAVFTDVAMSLAILSPTATAYLLRQLTARKEQPDLWRVPLIAALGETKDPQAIPILLDVLHSHGFSTAELEAGLMALGRIYSRFDYWTLDRLGFHSNPFREPVKFARLYDLLPESTR